MGDRFHIVVGSTCNNNCLFCNECRNDLQEVAPALVRHELQRHAAGGDVMFASGEPTLEPRLPEYIRWARELGYRRIGVTTNARRLGYEAFARRLLESGLNHLVVSLHGPDARTHDAQTRTPGSFDQTLAGLATAARLRRDYPLSIHSSTVVSRRNVERLVETFAILRPFEIEQHVFNVVQPLGRAMPLATQLMARYSDVAAAFERLLQAIPPPRPFMFLVDIPFCTTEGLPDEVRGQVEAAFFNQVRADGTLELRELRVQKHGRHGEKRAECSSCRYDAVCLGVWRDYVRAHGWGEFTPVPLADGPAVALPLCT